MDKNPNSFFHEIVNKRMITRNVKGKVVVEHKGEEKISKFEGFEKTKEKEYIKAFESEDRISLKNDLKKLGYNYKLSSYAKEIYNDFLKIQRKCENIKKVEELQSYVDYVIKMKKVILNKLNSGQYSIEDKNLITYINKWLDIQKQKGVNVPKTNLKDNIPKYTGAKIKDRDASDLTSYYIPKNSEKFDTIVDSELISEENEKNIRKLQDQIIDERRKKLETKLKNQKERTESFLKSFENHIKGFIGELEKIKADKDQKYNQTLEEKSTEINNVIQDSITKMQRFRDKLESDSELRLEFKSDSEFIEKGISPIIRKLRKAKKVDLYEKGENLPQEEDLKTNLQYLCKFCNKKYKKIPVLSLTDCSGLETIKEHCKKYTTYKKHFLRFLRVCKNINEVRQNLLSAKFDLSFEERNITRFISIIKELKLKSNLQIPNNLEAEKNNDYVLDDVINNISGIRNNLHSINGEVEKIYEKWSESQKVNLTDDAKELSSNIYDYKKDSKEINEFKNLDVENAIKIFTEFKKLCKNPSEFYDIYEIKTNFKQISNFVREDEFYSDINLNNNIINKFEIDLDSILAAGRNNEGKWEKYKDLPYKARIKIIEQWIPSLNKIIELKSKSKDELDKIKLANYKLFLTYLKIVDNYFAQNQNESKDGRYNKLGFNTVKNVNGKEFTIEKKMWNVKRQGKTSSTIQSYFKPYFSVKDVQQGDIGDCWLESTLKSMVLKSPDKLLEVFPNYLKEVSNIDGSLLGNQITVRLYDYRENYSGCYNPKEKTSAQKQYYDILVDATELIKDENKTAWNNSKVLWPHIIEKAIDRFIEKFQYDKTNNYGEQIDSGHGSRASVMLTGKPTKMNEVSIYEARALEQLKNALTNSDAPTCGTKTNFGRKNGKKVEGELRLDEPNPKDSNKKIRFLWDTHAYTLKDIKEDKKNILDTEITLINPWGELTTEEEKEANKVNSEYYKYNNSVGREEITINLKEFIEYFEYIYC